MAKKKAAGNKTAGAVDAAEPGAEVTPTPEQHPPLYHAIMQAFGPDDELTRTEIGARTSGWDGVADLTAAVEALTHGVSIDGMTLYARCGLDDDGEEVTLYGRRTATAVVESPTEPTLIVDAIRALDVKRADPDYVVQTRNLICVLTEEEKHDRREEAGDHNEDTDKAEFEMSVAKASFEEAKKRADVYLKAARRCLSVARSGRELRPVECAEVLLPKHKLGVTLRVDTHEILDRRKLSEHELQGRLF